MRTIVRTLAIAASLGLIVLLVDAWTALGRTADGDRRARVEASARWTDGQFHNPQPLWTDVWGFASELVETSDHRSPDPMPPVVHVDPTRFASPPTTGLRVTWLGHSTLLLEIDGARILTDPVWGERASPSSWIGPKRWYAPLLDLDEVPKLDAVVISHDHYDHLDYATITAMKDWDTTFITPLGVGSHLAYWGVPDARIVELDWWDETRVGDLTIVCTPARHASGRTLVDRDTTLWAGYAFKGSTHRVYFSGDTGYFRALEDIGERLGPFDLTLIEAGAYGQSWPDWHMGPEQAVKAHLAVRGRTFMAIHWGLFDLAFHGWTEPIERVREAALAANVPLLAPRPGESIEPERLEPFEPWWPELPWRTAEVYPIVATEDGHRE